MMKHLLFFISIICFFLFYSCSVSDSTTHGSSPPNIILFLVDDLGWQDTSVPLWKKPTPFNLLYETPNMERLAREGMKFTQAYATPVCSPSRISLMTGMNAARHRVTNWTLRKNKMHGMEKNHQTLEIPFWNVNGLTPDPNIPHAVHADALPQLLKNAGYHTIHAGKAHLGAIGTPAADPTNIGFDINIAGHAAGAPKSYLGTKNFGNNEKTKGTPWPVPGLDEYHGQEIFLTEALTLEVKKALAQPIQKETPFFLYMSYYGVHTPITADERFFQTYIDKGLDTIEARYASMIAAVDKSVGDVLDFLEENKIEKETVILFMSDNGGLSAVQRGGERHQHNKPLSSGKGSIHEGGIREPMFVKWPGKVKPNSVNNNYLIIEDFFPTILEMAGVEGVNTVQEIDGISIVDELVEDAVDSKQSRPLFWHYPNEWGPTGPGIGAFSAVRQGDWKLIYYHSDQNYELFDINSDIGETNNLADVELEKRAGLSKLLAEYLKSVDAQMPRLKASGELVALPGEE